MIDFVFNKLQQERRARKNRRSSIERRAFNDPNYTYPERRKLKRRGDRPTRKDWLAA
jgi:hypothetical protein